MPQAAPGELVLHALLSTIAYAWSLDRTGALQHRGLADEASPDGMSNSYNGDPMKSLNFSFARAQTLLLATSLLCGAALAEKPEWAGEGGGKGQKHERKNEKEGKGPGVVQGDRKSTRLNSSHIQKSRMPSSA